MAALGLRAASSRPASLALPRPLRAERCNIVFAAERRYRLSLALSPHPFLVRLHRTAAVPSSCVGRACHRIVRAACACQRPASTAPRRPLAVGPRFSTYRSPNGAVWVPSGLRRVREKGENRDRVYPGARVASTSGVCLCDNSDRRTRTRAGGADRDEHEGVSGANRHPSEARRGGGMAVGVAPSVAGTSNIQ